MSPTKIALIVGGSALGLYLVWGLAKASATKSITAGGSAGTASTGLVSGSSGGGTGTSGGSSPGLLSRFYSADKNVLETTASAVKSVITIGGLL